MTDAEKTTAELLAYVVSEGLTYPHVVALTRYMADHDYDADAIAYAVEKPHKHADLIAKALEETE